MDVLAAGTLKCTGTGIHRRAGGHDVVEDEYAFRCRAVFGPEGTLYVAAACGRTQVGLGFGVLYADEVRPEAERRVEGLEAFSQFKTLVESPLPQFAGMEGDGNNCDVGEIGKIGLNSGGEETGEVGDDGKVPVVFEGVNGIADAALIAVKTPGPGVSRVGFLTARAAEGMVNPAGNCHTALFTPGRRDDVGICPAVPAEAIFRVLPEGLATGTASPWEGEIQETGQWIHPPTVAVSDGFTWSGR